MCDVGLLTQILLHCKAPLENENHPLHRPFQYLLERLAAQRLAASDLRTFLRLGDPLTCLNSGNYNNEYYMHDAKKNWMSSSCF